MEDNKENDKIEINQGGLEKLLVKSLGNFQEERDLALERYRRQDENMVSNDDFILQGKTNVDYLKVAADRSNAVFGVAKLITDILYKNDSGKPGTEINGSSDAQKREILTLLKEMKGEK